LIFSGAATFVSNTLNIPNYTLAGLGGITGVTGTTNRITVTGGTAIDIASTYVGQNTITTLGTITTGVWNGTAIANANLANSTISGISLGSNLATLTIGTGLSGISYNGGTAITIASTITQYTDALARAAITLTTTGTGVATYSGGTLNIPTPTLYNDHFKTQTFTEAASGSSGQVNTLSNTPKDTVGVRVSLNGSALNPANYTVSGATVQVTLPVFTYDVVTISFLY